MMMLMGGSICKLCLLYYTTSLIIILFLITHFVQCLDGTWASIMNKHSQSQTQPQVRLLSKF